MFQSGILATTRQQLQTFIPKPPKRVFLFFELQVFAAAIWKLVEFLSRIHLANSRNDEQVKQINKLAHHIAAVQFTWRPCVCCFIVEVPRVEHK